LHRVLSALAIPGKQESVHGGSQEETMKTNQTFSISTIGKVKQEGQRCLIEVLAPYRAGLTGLDEFSHVMVVWLFDRVSWDRRTLTTPPCYRKLDHELGVFATRGPLRPNPMAVSNCRIFSLDVESGILAVDWIDAEPDTPVVDLKPYHPSSDVITEYLMPEWCSHWPKSREASSDFDWGSEFTS
jgi:tRNA-Thr(GGU) m(6)t(6)A37 methyltransferase TsaA